MTASIDSITLSDAIRSCLNSSGLFTERKRSKRRAGINRKEAELGADAARLHPRFADVVDRLLHRIEGARRIRLRLRDPERMDFLLKALHAVPKISGLFPPGLGIDEDRQI